MAHHDKVNDLNNSERSELATVLSFVTLFAVSDPVPIHLSKCNMRKHYFKRAALEVKHTGLYLGCI